MDPNREFAEMVGLCWHEQRGIDENGSPYCSCGFKIHITASELDMHIEKSNSNYAADPRLVLREMRKREDWPEFIQWLFREYVSFEQIPYWLEYFILDTTGRCLCAAIEFMKEEKP